MKGKKEEGYVVLSLSQEEVERTIAVLEEVEDMLAHAIQRSAIAYPDDETNMHNTFRIARTALAMVWLNWFDDDGKPKEPDKICI